MLHSTNSPNKTFLDDIVTYHQRLIYCLEESTIISVKGFSKIKVSIEELHQTELGFKFS